MTTKFRWETEFKETEIGEIPREWVIKTLDDIKRESIVGCTPLRRSQEYWVNGIIPWVTNKEVEYGSINSEVYPFLHYELSFEKDI